MTLSLSWTENKHRKHGKANRNYQNVQATRHLETKHSHIEDVAGTIVESKSKIEAKKKGIERNLLSSSASDEKDASKKLIGSDQMRLPGALSWRDTTSCEQTH